MSKHYFLSMEFPPICFDSGHKELNQTIHKQQNKNSKKDTFGISFNLIGVLK